ncbi:Uncharacterized protein BP5553_00168 [Venustampulla echinocandica]|uniref:Chromosome transmission fidelity protein 8 n=1 Tax=Venustampulla echinocandica TaxID=2656787 RepID=A0A370TXF8_9HELO|nr:Uncharacterized protein BP5553_00168 [Venustampulla echinocandica]RDL40189.1 Uncharacterized protein BP5553_00168 [Venustampulla echinocandica]
MSLTLHTTASRPENVGQNPLPQLLQVPSGLALLELQGTINLPDHTDDDREPGESTLQSQETPIGRLIFPLFDADDPGSTAWMTRVHLYVGKHQRLTGEVKKLPKAIAIIRKRTGRPSPAEGMDSEQNDELEVVEIVKYKIMFSSRPEPVGADPIDD